RRACSLVPHTFLPGLLTRASLLFCVASSPSLLACASYILAGSAHPREFTFLRRKFAEPARLCLIHSCRVCSPARVYFSASQVRRACSLVPHTFLPGLLTRASLLFCVASSPSLLACASYILAGSAHPREFTFLRRKFAEPARLCLIHSCRVCSPARVYFSASQVRRACSLVPHTFLPGLLTRASLLFCVASSPSLLACASYILAGSAHPREFTFLRRKFAEPARLCLIHSCRVCSPARVYFSASQVRRACSLVPHTFLPGLLTRASLLFCVASSPSLLACASYILAGSAHPREFTFLRRKFAEPARLCLIHSCRVCSPARVYFSASQVRRACSLVPHTFLPGLLTRASLLFCVASSPSLLACASYILAGSAHPREFTFLRRKFAEPARLCLIHSCRVCSPARVYFSASQVRRACSLVPHTFLPGLLTRASLLFCVASSPSLLACASYILAGSAHPREFTFLRRKFAEPARLCLIHSCRVCSPARVYFSASQVRRACSLVPHTFLPGLLTRASLLFCVASSPSLLACASYILAGSAHPREFTFLRRKFAEPARLCLIHSCRVCSPARVYFSASQVRRACSLVPHTFLPGLLTRASLLFCVASSPSLLACASYILAGSAHPREFTFLRRKFAEPARLCLIHSCRVCSPARVYFSASQVRRACSLVPHTFLPGLLTRASLLFCVASSPSLLACASYILAGSAHPREFTFLRRKFAEPARLCLIHSCRVCSPARVYFSASQVRRACSLVPHTFLPGLLTRASLLFCVASSPSLLACASYILAGSAHPREFTFLRRKFAEPARLCLIHSCRVCSPARVYFSASQVRRACSLVPHTFLPGLLTRASLLFCVASSPSLLACASYILAGSAHPREFTFLRRKFAEPARLCLIHSCRVCSPARVYFSASQVRRACSLVPHTILPGLLTRASLLFCFPSSPSLLARASCNLAWSAHLCEFTFRLCKFAELARSCLLQPCWICSLVRVYFSASQVCRAFSLVPLATLPGLLTRASLLFCFANSPSLLACASYNLAGSAHPCEFTFLLRKFAEPGRLSLIKSCRVRRACSLVPHTTLPGLLTRASLLFCFPSPPSLLARASCNLAWSARLCEFTFRLCMFAEPASSCLLQPCRVCSPVRVYFSASQVRRACSLVPHTILPGTPSLLASASYNLAGSAHPCEFTFLLPKFAESARSCLLKPSLVCSPFTFLLRKFAEPATLCLIQSCRVSSPVRVYFFCFASSSSLLACASYILAGSAHPREFTFLRRKFAEPARLCLIQSCQVCSPVRVYFSSSQVRRACSLVPHKILPGVLTRASLLFCFANSPSLLACASYNLARSAHPCEFTFLLPKSAESARSCLMQPCRVCSPRASLLFGCACSPSLLVRAFCNLAGSAHLCEFTFPLRKFAEPARLCLIQSCQVCSPVRVYFSASQVRRVCSLVPHATLPSLLTPCEFTFRLCMFAEPASSCLLQPCWIGSLVCSPVRVYFSASQVRRVCSLVPHATLPSLLTPCEFTFRLCMFAEPASSCLLQPCWIGSLVRVYFSASQIRRACSLVPHTIVPGLLTRASLLFASQVRRPGSLVHHATLSGLLTRANLLFASQVSRAPSLMHLATLPGLLTPASILFRFASSLSHLHRASCSLAGFAHPCEFTFLRLRRACYLVPHTILPGFLTRASLLFCVVSSPSLLPCASYNLAGFPHPCEFTFLRRKFAEPATLCLIQSCRVSSPVRVYFSSSQVRRACSLVPHKILLGLLTRASSLFCFANSPSLLACASYNRAGSAHPREFTFLRRKFAEPATLCLIQSCRVCSPARVYFSASQLLACASHNLAESAHPVRVYFSLRKFAESARSCLLQPCLVCSPVRVYFSAVQVRRACSFVPLETLLDLLTCASLIFASQVRRAFSLVPLATLPALPGLLTRASLLFPFASSPYPLALATCNLAGSAHPCEFTFPHRKFAEPARSCILQPCRVCSPVRVYFYASQVRRACSLVPHTILPGLLTRASLLFCFPSSPSLLARASCNLAWSGHPCEFTFLLRRYAEPARLSLIQSCRFCSLVPLATLPGLLTCASSLFGFASSPSLLALAYCNLAGSAHPCEFTFLLRKFAELARLCLIKSCRVCSPVLVYFSASQIRRACSLVPHTILPGLLTRASLLFCFASSPSLLPCASYNLAGSAHPCEFTFLLRKFAEPATLCLIQSCRVSSPVRVYFSASQVRRVCSPVPLATLPGLVTRASLLFCFASSPSLLPCASYNLAGSAHPCEFTFLLPKFAESARPCLLQPCLVWSPVRVYFSASQVRRACYLVPHTILPGQLTRASLLFCFPSSPSLLARASCNLAWSGHPCEFTFLLRKFAEPATLCLIQSCRVSSPVRVYFSASQVRRVCSPVPLATLPGLVTRASLLFCFASSPSLLPCASYNLAGSAHPCEFTFLLPKFAESARPCLLQPCLVWSPVRVYFSASQVRRACYLVPHTILPGQLTRASLLFCFPSSPSLLARASCNLAWSGHPCEFTFLLRKFAEPATLCLIQSCRVSSPVRVYFSASQVRRVCSPVPLATLPGLVTRASLLFCFASSPSLLPCASYNLAGSAHPCEFTFLLPKFAESARPCLLQPCLVWSPVRVYFSASQVRRACYLVPHTILPGQLTRASLLFCFPSSPSLLARASCNLAWSGHPCEFTFLLRKFAEPATLCLIQSCRVSSPVRVYFSASQVRRVCSPVPLATLPGLVTRASLLFCFASSPSLLPCASYNLAGSAHPCEFTFLLPKFAESARPCLLQPCLVWSPVRVYFSASQVRRACYLVPHTILPGQLTRASLLFCFPSSPSLLARASCNLAWSGHPCEFTFLLRKFAEPATLCLIQSCRVSSPVRVYFSASQVRRVCSPVPLATLPGLVARASLLFCFAGTPRLLASASYNLAGSAHPCEFTFLLPKFAESAHSCLLQPCLVCSPVRVYFSAVQVRRACSFVPLANLLDLLTSASLLFRFASSPSLLARASCNLAGSAHPCEFTFQLPNFAVSVRSCLLQPCLVCSLVRVLFSASQVRRACSLLPIATLPGLLTRASLLFASQVRRAGSLVHHATLSGLLTRVNLLFASQVPRDRPLVHLATLPGLLTPASILFYFASSPSHLYRASCSLAGFAHLCELTFQLKFSGPARSCLLQHFRVCSPVRVYFSASQVRRACSLVPHTILPGLLTPASLLFCFANSPSLLACAAYNLAGSPSLFARASCNLAWFANPFEFTFLLRKFAESVRSCLLQPCLVCSPVRVYFSAMQVRRACSLVPHTILPGLLTRASLLFCFAGTPRLLASASYNLAGSAHPCEFTFLLPKFAESAHSCLLQPCLVCSPVRVYFSAMQVRRACSFVPLATCWICSLLRVYFSASQVRRAFSLVPLATLPGLLTPASLLFCFASSPSLLPCASHNLTGSAHPCEFIFFASQVRRACSLVPHTTLPGLLIRASLLFCFPSSPSPLTRASCNPAWSAHLCEFTFRLCKFAEPARSCLLQLAGSAHFCEFNFPLRKFAEPFRSFLLQPCRVCSP
ncbi:hypothetical protein CRG98_015112, partial [Punica granatum]